jgi:hypothetical protein
VKLQVAVAHYFDPSGGGKHGSLSPNSGPRVEALRKLILQLHRLFGNKAGSLNHMYQRLDKVDDQGCELKIFICVTGGNHLLDKLDDLLSVGAFQKVECFPSNPKYLGFWCHKILQNSHKNYDYSCYLEDDIIINDSDFFLKIKYFNNCFGDQYLLQPNRIETSEDLRHLNRFYIDGDYNPRATEKFRLSMNSKLCIPHLGSIICFNQPLNTHSGCFFLNSNQARQYFSGENWDKEDVSFHSPLESAATLGVMKEFQIMKPCLSNGNFLTVEHAGRNFMGLITPIDPSPS